MRASMGALLLAMLVLLGLLGPLSIVRPARAESDEWVLVVLPYFLQDMEYYSGYGDNAAVFLYGYGRVEAVVDLNHNGQADSGEPHILVERPGELVYVGIGVSGLYDLYLEFTKDPGPLWLLVKPPVFASYFVAKEGRFLAGYTAPPPGTTIWVPPFPGYVYVAPADPRGANVTVVGGDHDGETYSLGPMDYLVLRAGDTPYTLESDHPVAAILVNLFPGGASSYMVQLVPLEEKYEADAGIPLSPPTAPRPGGATLVTYYAAASTSGATSYGTLEAPANISDILGGPGVAYSLLATSVGDEVMAAAVAVYDVSAHPMLGSSRGFLTSITLYGGQDRIVSLHMARLGGGSRGVLLAKLQGPGWSRTADIVLPLPSSWEDAVYTITPPPWARYGVMAYVERRSPSGAALFYQLYEAGAGDWGMARLLLIPVSIAEDSPVDQMLGPNIEGASWSFMSSVEPVGDHYNVTVMGSITPPPNTTCDQVTSYVLLLNRGLEPLAYSKDKSCEMWVETGLNLSPWETIIGLHLSAFQDKVFLGGSFLSLARPVGAQLFQPGEAPNLTVWSRDEGVHSPTELPTYILHANYIDRGLYHAPENLTQKIEELVEGLEPLPNKYSAQENQTETQTPSGTGQPSPTTNNTTHAGTNITSWSGIPLKVGDTLTYKISLKAEGPNGTVKGSGEITIKVSYRPIYGGPSLELVRSELPGDVGENLLLISHISDVFYIPELYISSYNSSIKPSIDAECPILQPGANGEREGEATIYALPGILAKFKCTYSNGILTSIVVDINGEIQGKKISYHAEASLVGGTGVGGTQEGGAEGGAGSHHLPVKLIAIIVLLVAVVIGLAALSRRK